MKILYWGKNAHQLESKYGPSPIEFGELDPETTAEIAEGITLQHGVQTVVVKDVVECPCCGHENGFDVIRSFNFGIESVYCMECDTEFCNYESTEFTQLSHIDWDTIVSSLCT